MFDSRFRKSTLATSLGLSLIFWINGVCFQTSDAKHSNNNVVESSEADYNEGKQKLKQGDIDGALESFAQAIRLARNNYYPAAYYAVGVCYKAKGQDTQAIYAFNIHLQQAVGVSPDAHVELGELYMRNNLDAQAGNEFNQALSDYRGPAPKAHNALGKLSVKHGDITNAQWQFEQAISDSRGTYAEASMNLAELHMLAQSWDSAIKLLMDMLKAGSHLKGADLAKVHIDLGLCLFAKGDHQQAMEQWRESSTINPTLSQPHILLARMFELEQHISSAIKEYKTYIELDPNAKDAVAVRNKIAVLEQSIKLAEPPQNETEGNGAAGADKSLKGSHTTPEQDSGF